MNKQNFTFLSRQIKLVSIKILLSRLFTNFPQRIKLVP